MDRPIVARAITWRDLRPTPAPGPCVLCQGRRSEGWCEAAGREYDATACEWCGRPMHFVRCYLTAFPFEQLRLLEVRTEEEADRIVIVCPGCRS